MKNFFSHYFQNFNMYQSCIDQLMRRLNDLEQSYRYTERMQENKRWFVELYFICHDKVLHENNPCRNLNCRKH